MRIAMCDDEANVLEEIALHINKYCRQSGKTDIDVYPFSSASSLINSIDSGDAFDIYLLDVYIGNELGTELAREIRAKNIESPIMFLTTSIEHAPESFESDTLRYLTNLSPVLYCMEEL